MSNKGWIAVDLDGTLAEYRPHQGLGVIGKPIPLMLERVKGWVAEGTEVRIFTARVSEADDDIRFVHKQRQLIQDWLVTHGLPRLQVTNMKDYSMIELWDDRARRVSFNGGIEI